MAQCFFEGIPVSFPYEPYKVQEDFMSKVIICLKTGVNGILESPTGTGKTLSLLCSSLAWLECRKAQQELLLIQSSTNKDNDLLKDLKSDFSNINSCWDAGPVLMLPKIIYSSRTHSQLSQAVQELKRSSYKHMKSVVLGSREQLCLQPDVLKLPSNTAKVHACHAKISSKSCPHFLNYEEKILSTTDYQETPVTDIEDLTRLGRKHKVCPYYAARKLKSDADILFTPYNYIIDPRSRRAHGTELQGNILIFDEAHNIESACEESLSFQLRSYDLALCITEISQTMEMIKDFDSKDFNSSDNGAPDFTLADLSILKVMFCELEDILDKDVAENRENNGIKPGDYVIEVLSKVELTPQKKEVVTEILDKIILYHFTTSRDGGGILGVKGTGLQKFSDLMNILYSKSIADGYSESDLKQDFSTKFKVCLRYETQNKTTSATDPWSSSSSSKPKSWTLDFWCFCPCVRMQEIVDKGVYSIILTSGTLSPIGPMIAELGIDFPIQLENPHIIKDSQVFVAIVTHGPDKTILNSNFENRSNAKYINSLGRTISNFTKVVPDGLLVFFPSYSVLKSNLQSWEDSDVWKSLSDAKPLFIEPQKRDAFQESIDKYYATIKDPASKGATLMAVCRGKVSEGLDFADQNARGVVITGLPYPPYLDLKVKSKKEYLDSIAKSKKGASLSGNAWYTLQASRAVNQAIGRVIRHRNDFGAILLCDSRFQYPNIQQQLSKWIHGRITVFDSFGTAFKQLTSFFKNISQESLKPKPAAQHIGSFCVNGSVLYSTMVSNVQTGSNEQRKPTENIENILESYKTEKDEGLLPCKRFGSSSIFDEFAKTPMEKSTSLSQSCSSSSETMEEISSKCDQPKEAKRRRIAAKFRSADGSENEKKSHPEKWKKYLLEVKSLLKTDKYGEFCSSVKEYKATKNVENFALTLMNVFAEIPNSQTFLQTVSLLVDLKQREMFLSICFGK